MPGPDTGSSSVGVGQLVAQAPAPGASLAEIEAYQATIPGSDLSNPQIAQVLKQEGQQALGGYWEKIPII